MREIGGVDKQKKLVQVVLDEKEVSLLINDIEELKWFDIDKISDDMLVKEHVYLFGELKNNLNK